MHKLPPLPAKGGDKVDAQAWYPPLEKGGRGGFFFAKEGDKVRGEDFRFLPACAYLLRRQVYPRSFRKNQSWKRNCTTVRSA